MSTLPLVQLAREEFEGKAVSLRTAGETVHDFNEPFQKIVNDLLETFWSHKIAVGLAAPQVGIQLKLAVINHTRDKSQSTLIIVNPRILSTSGKKNKKKESCMSLPFYSGEVERRSKLSLSYQDRYGAEKKLDTEGYLARVIQHEVDHLEGILYIDRMEDVLNLEKTDVFEYD
jgi:peptide deformylase